MPLFRNEQPFKQPFRRFGESVKGLLKPARDLFKLPSKPKPPVEPFISPISEEETQDIRISQGEREGKFISPVLGKEPPAFPAPTPTPKPDFVKPRPEFFFEFDQYKPKDFPEVPQPSKKLAKLIFDSFPTEATAAATVAFTENGSYNPKATNVNKDGSKDYGIFQINDGTFKDMMSKNPYKRLLGEAGISSLDDLLEEEKNVKAAKVVKKYEEDSGAKPWSWWYGWVNKGFNLGI